MAPQSLSLTRRGLLAASVAAGAVGALPAVLHAATDNPAIRPFRVAIPKEDLADLRRRLAATRWPDRETVADRSQGVRLAAIKELVQRWQTDYDWRKAEAKLNAHPQFLTAIDGLDIHFLHVRSRHPDALPLIITHGWPGSVFELLSKRPPRSRFRWPSPCFRGRSTKPRRAGRGAPTAIWATSMRSTGAVTSRPGRNRTCSAPNSAPHSGRCADRARRETRDHTC